MAVPGKARSALTLRNSTSNNADAQRTTTQCLFDTYKYTTYCIIYTFIYVTGYNTLRDYAEEIYYVAIRFPRRRYTRAGIYGAGGAWLPVACRMLKVRYREEGIQQGRYTCRC